MRFRCLLLSLMGFVCAVDTSAQSVVPNTAKELFREAVTAGGAADGKVQWYIFSEIAQAQAAHGYYDDATETSKLVSKYPDQLFVKLVRIRAKNGDTVGAKKAAATAPTPALKSRADEAVAIVQAEAGDLNGARDTSLDLSDKSSVLEAIGTHQAEQGDLEGALTTASKMKPGWSDGVLFEVAQKLLERGDTQRAHEIALRITDPDMAHNAEAMRSKLPHQLKDACALAWDDARARRYAEAYKKIEGAKCDCRTVAYIHEEARDPVGAGRAMRSCPNPADVSAGMAELAKRSAQREDISDALRFAESVTVTGASYEEGYLAPALRDIGRAWARTGDSATVLGWARSRPNGFQRAMALVGVAESISSSGNKPQAADR